MNSIDCSSNYRIYDQNQPIARLCAYHNERIHGRIKTGKMTEANETLYKTSTVFFRIWYWTDLFSCVRVYVIYFGIICVSNNIAKEILRAWCLNFLLCECVCYRHLFCFSSTLNVCMNVFECITLLVLTTVKSIQNLNKFE